jgi:CRISPR-associated protein Csd1
MILQALAQLAAREGLVDDPCYEPAPIAYFIHLGSGGRYEGTTIAQGTQQLDARGRPKGKPKLPARAVPRRSDRTVQNQAEFLVDKAEYVFGIDPTGKRDPGKLAARRELFRSYASEAAGTLGLPALHALEAFLRGPVPPDLEALLHPDKESEKTERGTALFGFVYEPDGGVICVHDDPRVHAWFADHLTTAETPIIGQCLVTGAESSLTRLHAKPKGIPPRALTKGGVPLTSTNAQAFTSYGLEGIGCAPISRTANIAIETALNRLLDASYKTPAGESCPPRSIPINPETAFLFWSREDSGLDWLSGLDTSSPDDVAALIRSPYKSGHAPLEDPGDFYGLVLSGMQGRAIVRSFLQSTVQDVAGAVDRYRDEVTIAKPYGQPPGSFSLFEYRRALAPLRDIDRLAPALGTDLYLAIISGRPFPRAVLQAIVSRNRVEFLPKKERSDSRDEMLLAARSSLLKAYLIRNEKETIAVALDHNRKDSSYRLGRLLAVIDRIQAEALTDRDSPRKLNSTLIDRYYGSASSTPAAVFPSLLRRSRQHLAKLHRDKPGLAHNAETVMEEIFAELHDFPKTMPLEAQGQFAIGFYHQKNDKDAFKTAQGEGQV